MESFHITGGWLPESVNYDNYFSAMDGDTSKILVIDPTSDGGGLIMPSSYDVGRRIKLDFVPTKLRRHGPGVKQNPLLDCNGWLGSTLLAPQAYKDILEELEPGVHQFFPMEYYQKKEKIGEGYWFVCCQRIDTLHDTACEPPRNERGFVVNRGSDGKFIMPRIVFSEKKSMATILGWINSIRAGIFLESLLTGLRRKI